MDAQFRASNLPTKLDHVILPPNRIDILCPKCSAVLGTADPAFRLLRFPSISCSCGFTGPYDWVNPQLGISVAEAIAESECRRSMSRT